MKILLDTNFIVALASQPVKNTSTLTEQYGQVQYATVKPVLVELRSLSMDRGSTARFRRALLYSESLEVFEVSGDADQTLLECASHNGFAVATLDGELALRLRQAGVPVVTLSGGRVRITGGILR